MHAGIYIEIHLATVLRRGMEDRRGIAANFDRHYNSVRVRECRMPRVVQESFRQTEGPPRLGRSVSLTVNRPI